MEITYLGHSSFKLRGKKAVVVTDPFNPKKIGLKFPKTEADIVTVSHQHEDHNAVSEVGGTPFVVDGPGEYEIKSTGIIGIPAYHDNEKGKLRGPNTVYSIEVDGVHIIHMGDIGEMLTDKEIEQLGTADVLLIPVGGVFTIDEKQASELVKELEPSVVIPMHYGRPELDQKMFSELAPVSSFLKLMGQEQVVPQPKLSITKDKIPEQMQVVILE